MASINKRPQQQIHSSRNDFDMSQRQLFTSSVGHCLPVYYDLLNPGDTVKLESSLFSRTRTLSSAALTRITEHIDYFFVPYRRIWSNFPQWYTSINVDVISSVLSTHVNGNAGSQTLPIIYINKLIENIDTNYSQSSGKDSFGVLKRHNADRLLDLLGYGCNSVHYFLSGSYQGDYAVSPALLCAYHAINRDFYTLTDRNIPDIKYSSMDDYSTSFVDSGLLSIYYRPWKRDFYTNVEVSPLFAGFAPNTPTTAPAFLSNFGVSYYSSPQYSGPAGVGSSATSAQLTTLNTSTNVDAVRRAAALERYAQLMRFNDKYWNVQMTALFGMEAPDDYGHVMYLGSHHSNINIQDVVATSTTSDSTLGQISGKGINIPQANRKIEFTAKQHGFVMAIYSATPESDYRSSGLDRLNTYFYRNDFFMPQYDGLGMQPTYAYESNFVPDAVRNNTCLGWQYRWNELKQKPDLIHGGFNKSLGNWVTSRTYQTQGIDYTNFCVDPSYLDSIMLTYFKLDTSSMSSDELQAYAADSYGRDPLLHELYFKVIKLSKMSKYSLPRHNEVML